MRSPLIGRDPQVCVKAMSFMKRFHHDAQGSGSSEAHKSQFLINQLLLSRCEMQTWPTSREQQLEQLAFAVYRLSLKS